MMSASSRVGIVVAAAALFALSASACSSDTAESDSTTDTSTPARPAASEQRFQEIDSANFDATSTTIDNRYMPLKPGTRLVYRGSDLVDGKRVTHRVDYIV